MSDKNKKPEKRDPGEGSIYPFRNGYAAYVWVHTPAGERTRKYVYGKTRDIVHAKWIALHALAKKQAVPTTIPRLDAHINQWLTTIIKPNRAPKTYSNYEIFSRLYIIPSLGHIRLDRLTVAKVQEWVNSIPTVCQCCTQGKDERRTRGKKRCCAKGKSYCCGQAPSNRSISDIRNCLRSALTIACKQEIISKNVAALVTLPKVRKRKGKSWDSEEAHRFLESALHDNDPFYAAYILILLMGFRKGEVLGLSWDDVDFAHSEISPRQQLQRVSCELLLLPTKTDASDDPLPLIELCATILKRHRAIQQTARLKAGDDWQETGLVFTTASGRPIEPRNFDRSWHGRIIKAGVRRVTVHDGRRTCATLLVDLEVHPRHIMRILRHADFSVTMEIYARASTKATKTALQRLGDVLAS
jgi:integrase